MFWTLLDQFFGPRPLHIDMRRVNVEECRIRREELVLEDDAEFRAQVKRRMMEGEACPIEPWYRDRKPTRRLRVVRMEEVER